MEIDFTGKVVLVTGASAGIGEATAVLFAKCGASLALVGRDATRLRSVAQRCLKERNLKPLEVVADLSTDEGCETTARVTLDHFKRLDVLVNNAGCGARTCIERADMATFDRVFALDVRGVYNLTRLLVPALVQAKGNIVNISSISGSAVVVGSLPYSMAKAALDHFTRLLALELGPKGVRVNAVSPGITESKFVQTLTGYSEEQYGEWLRRAAESVPMRRVCSGEDIARAVAMLASHHSALLTGAVVPVDGALRFNQGNSSLISEQMK